MSPAPNQTGMILVCGGQTGCSRRSSDVNAAPYGTMATSVRVAVKLWPGAARGWSPDLGKWALLLFPWVGFMIV